MIYKMNREKFEEFKRELETGEYNCIVVKNDVAMHFRSPGVKTLMTLLNEDPSLLENSTVFDTIVGKGAAALLILGKVREVYAEVLSENAVSLLEEYGLKYSYKTLVTHIENRTKTGLCPIENISMECSTPEEVKARIIEFISSKPTK